MGTQTQFIKMTQDWDVHCGGGERNRKQKKGENLCLLNICYVWNIKLSLLHIFLLLILTTIHWVDVMIPNLLIRTWRLNNIYKVKQWWSWGLKLGLLDFESLLFPGVPLAPKTGLFWHGSCKLPFSLLPKHLVLTDQVWIPSHIPSCSPSPESSKSQPLCGSSSHLGAHLTLPTQHSLLHLFLGFHLTPG